MKKIIAISFFICLANTASAQFTGGFKAGLNVATFTGSDSDGSEPRAGFNAGIYLTFDLSNKVSFQPELLVNTLGAKTKESGTDEFIGDYKLDGTLKITYISVPAIFIYKLNDNFNFQGGPQFSYLTSAQLEYDLVSDAITQSGSTGADDELKKFDMGLALGVGAATGPVNFSLRYYMGLLTVSDQDMSVKNSAFMFSVGYNIPKK